MQTQHITDAIPNVISITQIRQDIDSLTDLLEKYPEVKVLRGQSILFHAVRPEAHTSKQKQRQEAAEFFRSVAKKHKVKKGEMSATEWLIRERDRMRTKEYYEEHNR